MVQSIKFLTSTYSCDYYHLHHDHVSAIYHHPSYQSCFVITDEEIVPQQLPIFVQIERLCLYTG